MKRLFFLHLIFVALNSYSQKSTISFQNFKINNLDAYSTILTFQGATYTNNFLPIKTIHLKNNFFNIEIIDSVASICTKEEIELLTQFKIDNKISFSVEHGFASGKKHTVCNISPWFLKNGTYYKCTAIEYVVSEIKDEVKFRKTTTVSNSVLQQGTFHKFAIPTAGIYKITYADLLVNGVISGDVNSSQITTYGNSSKMLSFINTSDEIDDLVPLPIKIIDGTDGVFENGDYILFYGNADGFINLDNTSNLISKEINLYSDTNYIYISLNSNTQKLVKETPYQASLPIEFNSYKFHHHEKEWLNFIKSGRQWVGESFEEGTLLFNLDYKTPIDTTQDYVVNYQLCARSSDYSNNIIDVAINNDTVGSHQINKVSSVYYNDYVKFTSSSYPGVLNEDALQLKFQYRQITNPLVWLDYFSIQTVERLTHTGSQMTFFSFKKGNQPYNLDLKNNLKLQVWNITDFENIISYTTSATDSSCQITIEADSMLHLISFTDESILKPIYKGHIKSQNLHALPSTNYIIITTQTFTEEAQRLIDLHQKEDNLSGQLIYTSQIYNEFSCGRPEASAIRNCIKMLYEKGKNTSDSLQYVLLLGDGSYDPKNRLVNNVNHIPTFQSKNSIKLTSSYVTDDFYGLLDDGEGDYLNGDLLDVGVGRFPVKTKSEATKIVDKIYEYYNNYNIDPNLPSFQKSLLTSNGAWKNNILFVADDEDFNEHMKQADNLATYVDTALETFNVKKVFLDSYTQESSISGNTSPEANKALMQNIEDGVLVINYTGHGGELGWTEEQILLVNDIKAMKNRNNLPLFMTATCEFSRFDDPQHNSAGEYLILQKQGGAIGLFTTVRLVFSIPNFKLNQTFYKTLEESISNSKIRLGDVFRLTKVNNNGGTNDRNFTLLGDPALTLAFPLNDVIVDSIQINQALTDTLKSLSKPKIYAHIESKNQIDQSQYNGWAEVKIYDKKRELTTLDNDNKNLNFNYSTQSDLLFKGRTKVVNGKIEIETIIPKDIRMNFGFGKISIYAVDTFGIEAAGSSKDYVIGGSSSNAEADTKGPALKVFLEDTTFSFGDEVPPAPLFIASLFDSSGINIMNNDIGKDITLIIDDDYNNTITLNEKYTTSETNFRSGSIVHPLDKLENGRHSLTLKVYDNYNNSSSAYTEFLIESNPEMALEHVLNYPNPFTTSTDFYFEHNQSAEELDILIQIITISGKIIKTIETTEPANYQRIGPINWDGRDDFGDPIGRGVYLYKITVRNPKGGQDEQLQKLVILK